MNYSCLYLAEIRSIQIRCKFATICQRKGYTYKFLHALGVLAIPPTLCYRKRSTNNVSCSLLRLAPQCPHSLVLLVIGFPFWYDRLAHAVRCDFRCDDVIILQFDWTFLILGNRAKYLNLVHQTVSRACMQLADTGWVRD